MSSLASEPSGPDQVSALRAEITEMRAQLEAAWTAEAEQRALAGELQEASDAKSTFLAHISHEIRTQLSGIMGMTQVALDTRLTPQQREYLELAKSSGDALMTLVNDLLDLRKIELGKLDLEEIPFNLRDTLSDVLAVFEPRAEAEEIGLSLEMASDVPEFVSGDPGRLRQIVSNLVSNALKFTEDGSVAIRVSAERTSGEADFHLEVEDTGIGISAEEQPGLFQEFSQASTETARLYGGTGLGLAISRQLVERMGGSISVDSEPGRGSTFIVDIPFRLASERPNVPPLGDGRIIKNLPVLAVVNNPINERRLVEALGGSDLRLTVMRSLDTGLDALAAARSADAPFACVILDVQEDPLGSAALIRSYPEHTETHVVVMTAGGSRGDAARCRELRVAGYLTKPLSSEEIENAVRSVLAGALPVDLTTLVTRHWLRERKQRLDILVVDDSPTNRMIARRLLETRGHSVFSVVNGLEAIEALETFRFDLVLMDIAMPELDGLSAARAIRASETGAGDRTPIVATTTDDVTIVEHECEDAGMDGVLAKPFEVAHLTGTIEKILVSS